MVQVLLRALRDFNLGKLTADDTGIFMGLLNDIFPKTLESVPRAVNRDFETHVCALLLSTPTISLHEDCTTFDLQESLLSHRQEGSVSFKILIAMVIRERA